MKTSSTTGFNGQFQYPHPNLHVSVMHPKASPIQHGELSTHAFRRPVLSNMVSWAHMRSEGQSCPTWWAEHTCVQKASPVQHGELSTHAFRRPVLSNMVSWAHMRSEDQSCPTWWAEHTCVQKTSPVQHGELSTHAFRRPVLSNMVSWAHMRSEGQSCPTWWAEHTCVQKTSPVQHGELSTHAFRRPVLSNMVSWAHMRSEDQSCPTWWAEHTCIQKASPVQHGELSTHALDHCIQGNVHTVTLYLWPAHRAPKTRVLLLCGLSQRSQWQLTSEELIRSPSATDKQPWDFFWPPAKTPMGVTRGMGICSLPQIRSSLIWSHGLVQNVYNQRESLKFSPPALRRWTTMMYGSHVDEAWNKATYAMHEMCSVEFLYVFVLSLISGGTCVNHPLSVLRRYVCNSWT